MLRPSPVGVLIVGGSLRAPFDADASTTRIKTLSENFSDDAFDDAFEESKPRPRRRDGSRRRHSGPRRGGKRRDFAELITADDPDAPEPRVIRRQDHQVSRRDIDPDALKILYRLRQKGHRAYLVGGGVRDLMLGKRPKDFDIATDAHPGRLRRIFRGNCHIIGRRFQLAHLRFAHGKIIEVATFRSSGESDAIERDGDLIARDNVFGTPSEDARRRDLTINGLFYDISDFSILDYVDGFQDLEDGIIRTIVDPQVSFREDPVRMLRVLRHATRLDFDIEEETHRALESEREEILKANAARLLEEFYKDLASGRSAAYFRLLFEEGFLELLIPPLFKILDRDVKRAAPADDFSAGILSEGDDDGDPLERWLARFERLDERSARGEEISHALGLAALLAPLILPVIDRLHDHLEPDPEPFQDALLPAFSRLKIYRKDEDRLWNILGSWRRLERAFEQGVVPKSLSRRHYFPEAVEVFALLHPPSAAMDEFLEIAASLPPPTEEEPPRRRSRRRGGRGRSGGARGGARGGGGRGRGERSEEGASSSGDGAARGRQRKRRRRRRSSENRG